MLQEYLIIWTAQLVQISDPDILRFRPSTACTSANSRNWEELSSFLLVLADFVMCLNMYWQDWYQYTVSLFGFMINKIGGLQVTTHYF